MWVSDVYDGLRLRTGLPRFAQAWLAFGFKRIIIFSGSVKFLNP